MRKSLILPLAIAVALAACGKQEEAGKSGEAAAGGAAGSGSAAGAGAGALEMPEPGLYQQTVEIAELDFPGLPKGMGDQIKQNMAANMNTTDCLTPEESKEALKQLTSRGVGKDGECTYSKFDVSGGKLAAVMNCGKGKSTGTFTLAGSFSKTGSDMTVQGDQTDPGMPGGKMHMKMRMVSKRIGECKS